MDESNGQVINRLDRKRVQSKTYIIQTKVQLYENPVGEYVFFGPEVKIELTGQKENHFQVKVKKEIGPQDVGGQSYELVYALAYVNEEGRWKLDQLTKIQ